jgi:hypothetical protein
MVTVYVWPVVLLSFLSKESNQRKVAAWFRTVKGRAATMPVPAVRYAMPHLPLIVGFFGFRNSSPATQLPLLPLHASMRRTKQSLIGKLDTGTSKIATPALAMTRLNKKAAKGCFFVYVVSVLKD